MMAAIARIEGALHDLFAARGRFGPGTREVPVRALVVTVCIAGMAFGAVMGSFAGRPLQAGFSAVKVPMLLAVATLVGMPSFYAVNCALGLRDDFAEALRAVLAAQATLAVTLASLAPIELLAYASSASYPFAVQVSGGCFLLATLAGQVTLSRHYRELVRRNPRHRAARASWMILYVFVAIQAAWVLRPFVGDPHRPPTFFRANAWSNAYVVLFRDVLGIPGW